MIQERRKLMIYENMQNLSDFEYLKKRGVKELIHFTNIKNIESIIKCGILPRQMLDDNQIRYGFNDQRRLDGKQHLNLSITNPNIDMFYSFRKSGNKYVVLSIDISLLEDLDSDNYRFTSTNAASKQSQTVSVNELFGGQRGNIPDNCTTDNQAETLVNVPVDIKYVNAIYVENQNDANYLTEMCNIPILVDSAKHKYRKGLVGKGIEGLADLADVDARIQKIIDEQNKDSNKHEIIEGEINAVYLENWFATKKQIEDTQRLYVVNKTISIFDTYAVPAAYLDQKKYDKSTNKELKYWQIKYEPVSFQEKQQRNNNELAAIAVLEKIINRGRITRLSSTLEAQIKRNINDDDEYKTVRYVHQVQSTLVELVKMQKIKAGQSVQVEGLDFEVARLLFDDLRQLDSNIAQMYKVVPQFEDVNLVSNKGDVVITNQESNGDVVFISRSEQPLNFDREFTRVQERVDVEIDENILKYFLCYIFGFNEFRANQVNGILRALNHQDSIILLPTGSGKSIVYQLLALITPGISFVVDPITSLADDQVENLYRKGIDRVTELVGSTEDKKSVESDIGKGQYFMNFVAPERFQSPSFREMVTYYAKTNIISVIAIDEAHCVSEWGHDFRTSYLSLAQTCRTICTTAGTPPPLVALTGTASASVLKDMQRDLNILEDEAIVYPESFDRKEIDFRIVKCTSQRKEEQLKNIIINEVPKHFNETFNDFYKLNGQATNCGIVFSAIAGAYKWKSGKYHPFGTKNIQNVLNELLPEKSCGIYHGQIEAHKKKENARKFKNNELVALSSTKAYGMGIDKPNVRWAIHYGIPSSLEAYYQEAGRCARDGSNAVSWIVLSNDYPDANLRLLDSTKVAIENVQEENDAIKGSKPWEGDDVSRIIYFHTKAFSGVETELEQSKIIISNLLQNQTQISYGKDNKGEIEKTIYRLMLIGFVSDYTVDFANNKIDVKLRDFSPVLIENNYREYIGGYQDDEGYLNNQVELLRKATSGLEESPEEYLLAAVSTLLNEFTYKIVEEGRRIAMRNMLLFATEASEIEDAKQSGEYLRAKMLDYFATNETIKVEDLISFATDLKYLDKFFKKITSKKKADKVLVQINRLLEAYPQHFGLYYVMYKTQVKYKQNEAAIKSMNYALHYGANSYGLEKETLYKYVVKSICKSQLTEIECNVICQIVESELGSEYLIKLIDDVQIEEMKNPYLINRLNSIITNNIKEIIG
jgi:RecQ family ATP-dependent DNA helicase